MRRLYTIYIYIYIYICLCLYVCVCVCVCVCGTSNYCTSYSYLITPRIWNSNSCIMGTVVDRKGNGHELFHFRTS